ncbi:MAG: prolyl oligopeptidase family serine peptidase, partial [Gemmatimonadales bacterium]
VDAFRISPDNRHVAFWRLDQTAVPTFHLIDETSALYPTLTPIRYPKAGEANSTVRIGVAEIATGATRWMDLGMDHEIYVAGMDWIDAGAVWMTRFNRHQNRLDILEGTAATGATRLILSEIDEAWVDQTEPRWINNGREFLWQSEREGFNQVFRYRRDGTLVRRVTPGGWDVTNVAGVDERGGALYFGGVGEGPTGRQFYRVGLDGRNLRRLTEGPGWHQVSLDPAFRWFVDVHSTAATPPVQTLHRADGRQARVLADNAVLRARVDSLGLRAPEFLTVPGADGTELNAWIIRPPDFDPSRRYPVLLYVYGGPGSQTVTDTWGGQRYLWHQQLTQAGYIVASVDNRGTGQRGRAFKKATYLQLGVLEAADQVAAARWFARQPWVDGERIGIWGWSYGGYMSSLALFTGDGAFRAAIAVAPVTDWRFYDTIYTERYMRTPQENTAGYNAGAPLAHAARMQGRFLLVHGSGDDNVHAQNTTMLVEALQNANKQFDMRIYPNKTHSIAGRVTRINLYQMFTDWLLNNL